MQSAVLPMMKTNTPDYIQKRAEQMFEDVQFLENNGWVEECPTLYGWLFSHPAHGVHNFDHAIQIAHAFQNQVSLDTREN